MPGFKRQRESSSAPCAGQKPAPCAGLEPAPCAGLEPAPSLRQRILPFSTPNPGALYDFIKQTGTEISIVRAFTQVGFDPRTGCGHLSLFSEGSCAFTCIDFHRAVSQGTARQWLQNQMSRFWFQTNFSERQQEGQNAIMAGNMAAVLVDPMFAVTRVGSTHRAPKATPLSPIYAVEHTDALAKQIADRLSADNLAKLSPTGLPRQMVASAIKLTLTLEKRKFLNLAGQLPLYHATLFTVGLDDNGAYDPSTLFFIDPNAGVFRLKNDRATLNTFLKAIIENLYDTYTLGEAQPYVSMADWFPNFFDNSKENQARIEHALRLVHEGELKEKESGLHSEAYFSRLWAALGYRQNYQHEIHRALAGEATGQSPISQQPAAMNVQDGAAAAAHTADQDEDMLDIEYPPLPGDDFDQSSDRLHASDNLQPGGMPVMDAKGYASASDLLQAAVDISAVAERARDEYYQRLIRTRLANSALHDDADEEPDNTQQSAVGFWGTLRVLVLGAVFDRLRLQTNQIARMLVLIQLQAEQRQRQAQVWVAWSRNRQPCRLSSRRLKEEGTGKLMLTWHDTGTVETTHRTQQQRALLADEQRKRATMLEKLKEYKEHLAEHENEYFYSAKLRNSKKEHIEEAERQLTQHEPLAKVLTYLEDSDVSAHSIWGNCAKSRGSELLAELGQLLATSPSTGVHLRDSKLQTP